MKATTRGTAKKAPYSMYRHDLVAGAVHQRHYRGHHCDAQQGPSVVALTTAQSSQARQVKDRKQPRQNIDRHEPEETRRGRPQGDVAAGIG
jgi:hypothetical protein